MKTLGTRSTKEKWTVMTTWGHTALFLIKNHNFNILPCMLSLKCFGCFRQWVRRRDQGLQIDQPA